MNFAMSFGLHFVHFASGAACSLHHGSAGAPAAFTTGASKRSFGLHLRHCDSGTPCWSHQSPSSLKTATRSGLHLVHWSAGTPCSHCFGADGTATAAAPGRPTRPAPPLSPSSLQHTHI